MKGGENMERPKNFIVHDGYIGRFMYFDHGFPIYRFLGGDCVGSDTEPAFDPFEEAEKYCIEKYGHCN